ncbi:MAG: hypothetical protein QOH54_1833 [Mycobacterium sp.]|nr:hypothetical protein [Mycobacterium sp.]
MATTPGTPVSHIVVKHSRSTSRRADATLIQPGPRSMPIPGARSLDETHPLIVKMNRKAKQAEIRTLHRIAERGAEIVGIVREAVDAGDAELLGETQRKELQQAGDVLQKVANDVDALLWGGLEKLLDSGEDDGGS